MTLQVTSVLGAVMILAAYFAFQRGWLGRTHRSYHALNFAGAALLTVVAVAEWQIGFIIVEGTWALLSLPGTLRPPQAASPTSV
jgi:hypothetical protein